MIHSKQGKSLGEHWDLFAFDERGAGTDALLGAAAGVERDCGDAVVEHFFHKVGTGETGIAIGEIEAVGDRFSTVFVVGDVEAVVGKGFFHQFGFATIFQDIFAIVIGSVVDCFQHCGEGVLSGV